MTRPDCSEYKNQVMSDLEQSKSKKQAPLESALTRLETQLDILQTVVHAFEDRLAPIVLPRNVGSKDNDDQGLEPDIVKSKLTSRVEDLTVSARQAYMRLAELLDNLDI